ncbi:MAG: two-component sensor histidine kinase [Lachnospiraceae bacterium]|nr:two-component sensor histidine kinase [Lachnospiraceae bacterium]
MATLFDKFTLLVLSMLLFYYTAPETTLLHVLIFLSAIIFSCFCTCCNPDCLFLSQLPFKNRLLLISLWLILTGACLIQPDFALLLPLLFYEMTVSLKSYCYLPACLLPFLVLKNHPSSYPWMIVLLFLLTLLLSQKTKKLLLLKEDFRKMRDTSTEYNLLLQQTNQDLIEKQDHEIHIATLKERNRIAREIHDNVGHMLSRSILQTGALSAINRQENLKEPLCALTDTLSSAMNSVRESVHNLHDDSIDLKSAVSELISDFSDYQIFLDYDLESFTPASVKYCFLSILKEALSNIARHSNATRIFITLREHPSFHQLVIKDNGTNASYRNSGIGISNMQERVKNLKGNFSLSTDQGFQIFVTLPREAKSNTPQE